MKRTREAILYQHPEQRWNLSGCTRFDGEDLDEEARRRFYQLQQREWCMQQVEDKRQAQAETKRGGVAHDAQRLEHKRLNDAANDKHLAERAAGNRAAAEAQL